MTLKQFILIGLAAAITHPAMATCIQNNFNQGNLRVWVAKDLRVEDGKVYPQNLVYYKTFAPAEVECFPDNHPAFKDGDWFVFEPQKPITHVSRTKAPTVYYLSRELPDHASVSVEYTTDASQRNVTPTVKALDGTGQPFNPGQVLRATLGD